MTKDANIVIDGSRITSTRGGSFVTNETTVNGLEYKAGSGTSLGPVPEEATLGVLRGINMVGFSKVVLLLLMVRVTCLLKT